MVSKWSDNVRNLVFLCEYLFNIWTFLLDFWQEKDFCSRLVFYHFWVFFFIKWTSEWIKHPQMKEEKYDQLWSTGPLLYVETALTSACLRCSFRHHVMTSFACSLCEPCLLSYYWFKIKLWHQRLNWAGGYQSWAPGPDIAPCWRPAPSPLSWHYQLTYNSFTHCLTNQQERKKSALTVLYLESCLLSFMTFFLINWVIDWLIFNCIFKNENKIKQWECCGLYLEEFNSFNCYFKAFLFYADNEGETTFRTALRNYSGS